MRPTREIDIKKYDDAQRVMAELARLVGTWYNPGLGLLDGFLEQDRGVQQSIIGAFVQLLVDWRKGKKEDLVDERNKAAWGLASLVSDI